MKRRRPLLPTRNFEEHSPLSKRVADWGEDGLAFNYGSVWGRICARQDFFADARTKVQILHDTKTDENAETKRLKTVPKSWYTTTKAVWHFFLPFCFSIFKDSVSVQVLLREREILARATSPPNDPIIERAPILAPVCLPLFLKVSYSPGSVPLGYFSQACVQSHFLSDDVIVIALILLSCLRGRCLRGRMHGRNVVPRVLVFLPMIIEYSRTSASSPKDCVQENFRGEEDVKGSGNRDGNGLNLKNLLQGSFHI